MKLCKCGHPAEEFHEYKAGRCGSSECAGVCESYRPDPTVSVPPEAKEAPRMSALTPEEAELVALLRPLYPVDPARNPQLLALIHRLAGRVEVAEAGSHHSVKAFRLAECEKQLSEAHALIALQARVCEAAIYLESQWGETIQQWNVQSPSLRKLRESLSALRDAGKDGAS